MQVATYSANAAGADMTLNNATIKTTVQILTAYKGLGCPNGTIVGGATAISVPVCTISSNGTNAPCALIQAICATLEDGVASAKRANADAEKSQYAQESFVSSAHTT
jgi:hypothetical protein